MKRIRVLHVVPGMASGGVAKMVQEWYENINKDEIDMEVATLDTLGLFSDILKQQGCKIMEFKPLREVGIKEYIAQLDIIIKNGGYDIIHSHMGLLSFIVFIISKKYGIESRILHAHTNLFYNDNKKGIKRFIINIIKKICVFLSTDYVACTNEAGEYFFGKNIIDKSNYSLVLNGINVKRFEFNEIKRTNIRQSLNVNDKFIIGNIGRFSAQKNQKLIIDIFYETLKVESNCELWLIGEGEDEEMLKQRVKRYGIDEKVKFLEVRENVEDLLLAMDIFLMPSLFEGLGIVAVEAQASGLKCILSNMVPKEAKVTNQVKFVELDANKNEWVKEILNCKTYNRENTKNEVIKSGYDIYSTTKKLVSIYKKSISRNLTND